MKVVLPFLLALVYVLHHSSACHTSVCSNNQVTLSSSTATLELGSTTTTTLRCTINYGYDNCCYRYGHLNVTWYKDDIAINSNPGFTTSGTYLYVSSFGTYYSTLSLNGSVNIIHSGTYKCVLKVTNSYGYTYGPIVSTSVNLTVQIPHPTSVLTGDSIFKVGSTATLHCTEYLHQYSSYSSLPTTLTVELLKGTTTVMTRSIALSGSVTVHTSVFTIPNVGVYNTGQYQCRATVRTTQNNVIDSSPGVSNTANLTIQIPQPVVLLTGDSIMAGSTATLHCSVTLQHYSSYLSLPINVTVEILKENNTTLMIDSNPTGSGSVRTSVFTIPNVGVSNAGQYQCRAATRMTQNNVINSSPGVAIANITVQIPAPSASLTAGIVGQSSTATLQCMVVLHSSLTCSDLVSIMHLVSAHNIPVHTLPQIAVGKGSKCVASLTVSMAASSDDGGLWKCHVQFFKYNAPNSAYVLLPDEIWTNPETLYVVESTITSFPNIVLDVFPYNKFSLTCHVMVYPTTTIHSAIYQWTRNNAPQSNYSNTSPTVSVLVTSAGKSTYQCHVSVTVSQLNTAVLSTSTTVNVKGSASPSIPVNVTTSPEANAVNISFIVPRVTYTPETYSVRYGVAVNDIKLASTTVTSAGVDSNLSFITTLNQRYHITLFGLAANTTYYYQVVNNNCVSSVLTQVFNFTTKSELEANHSMLLNNFAVGFLAAFVVVLLVLIFVLLAVATRAVIVCRKKIMRRKMSDDTFGLINASSTYDTSDDIYEVPEPIDKLKATKCTVSYNAHSQSVSSAEYEHVPST